MDLLWRLWFREPDMLLLSWSVQCALLDCGLRWRMQKMFRIGSEHRMNVSTTSLQVYELSWDVRNSFARIWYQSFRESNAGNDEPYFWCHIWSLHCCWVERIDEEEQRVLVFEEEMLESKEKRRYFCDLLLEKVRSLFPLQWKRVLREEERS